MTYILGFSGSRYGMTDAQYDRLYRFLKDRQPDEFHHGDGGLSDGAAHMLICRQYRTPAYEWATQIVLHPSNLLKWQARCWPYDQIHERLPPLERDLKIAQVITHLVATPASFQWQPRSGTWATGNYTNREGKPVTLIYPDGTTSAWPIGAQHKV